MTTNVELQLCNRCESPIEAGDLRCSICGQSTPRNDEPVKKVEIQILRCTGCGAALAYDPKHQAPSCTFCDGVMQIETIEDPMEQTEGYLPFTVDHQEAHRALKAWLATLGWFRPSDLTSEAKLEELRPIFWVAWVFDAEAWVSWAADSNAGSRRSAWAPHAGQTGLRFDDILVSASRGLNEKEVSAITPGMDLRTVQADPLGAPEATIERFDLQRSQARMQVSSAIEGIAADRIKQTQIPGTRYRKLSVSVVLRKLVTRRLSLPAHILAYRYKNKLYRVVICGQDASRVTGSAPLSFMKILAVIAMVAVFIAIIAGVLVAANM